MQVANVYYVYLNILYYVDTQIFSLHIHQFITCYYCCHLRHCLGTSAWVDISMEIPSADSWKSWDRPEWVQYSGRLLRAFTFTRATWMPNFTVTFTVNCNNFQVIFNPLQIEFDFPESAEWSAPMWYVCVSCWTFGWPTRALLVEKVLIEIIAFEHISLGMSNLSPIAQGMVNTLFPR